MEQEKDPSLLYIKGFNTGYTLGKYEPELLNKILSSENDKNEYLNAVKAGKDQRDREQILEQMKREKEQAKNKGLER